MADEPGADSILSQEGPFEGQDDTHPFCAPRKAIRASFFPSPDLRRDVVEDVET